MTFIDNIQPKYKKYFLMAIDAIIIACSIVFSVYLLDGQKTFIPTLTQNTWLFYVIIPLRIGLIYFFGMYQYLWRYASTKGIVALAKSILIGSLFLVTYLYLSHNLSISKRLLLLECTHTFIGIGASRVALKLIRDYLRNRNKSKDSPTNIIIIGAGDAGETVAREATRPNSEYNLIGFVDDKPNKQKLLIHHKPVLGNLKDIPQLVQKHNIELAIIAIPTATGTVLRHIKSICDDAHIDHLITPALSDILGGKISISQLRDIRIEDLLRRTPVKLDTQSIADYISGETIMVTGAGGSIGSELCRQITLYSPKKILLLDQSENAIYTIHGELSKRNNVTCIPIVMDITHDDQLDKIFQKYNPSIIYHAAAHKHVPLMEANIEEAIRNNIKGALNVFTLADKYKASNVVLVSTDKAVRSTNVMGATKRVCEILVQSFSQSSQTKFSAVRFGNVLGSQGSVVPLFRKQIESGGPITITHPDMERFFMTIPEASSLIIQTGALSTGGEIFILDMGKPVKVIDLARDMIQLSGLVEGQDIDIEITGLRPGEKLYEELFFDKKSLKQTSNTKIFVTKPKSFDATYITNIQNLLTACDNTEPDTLKTHLFDIITST